MSLVIGWSFAIFAFLLATWSVFTALLDATNDQTDALRESNELNEERLRTLISITAAGGSGDNYVAKVLNRSNGVSFGEFSEIDLIARYRNATGDVTAKRLLHPSDWTVSSIDGDITDVVWGPGETATFSFSLTPDVLTCSGGTVAVGVPNGSTDTAYFSAATTLTCFLRNDPSPPVGDTASQDLLPMDGANPTATTLFNYDTDRGSCTGLSIAERAIGTGETDPTLFQDWRTDPLSTNLVISGDVSIDFWSGIRRANCGFRQARPGEVTMFLRDRDEFGGYTEVGTGSISEDPWQGAANDFVLKTITIPGVVHTFPAGHEVELKVIVVTGFNGLVHFAYDTTSYDSALKFP